MKLITIKHFGLIAGTAIGAVGLAAGSVSAMGTTSSSGTNSGASASSQAARLQLIISRGNSEISRRLTSLNTLDSKISAASKLSSDDQSTLTTEVNNEVSGLTSLKTSLDGDTTLSTAQASAESIFSDYRVYALVTPKVYLVKTADDQQVTEGKLTTLNTKLQAAITKDQAAGKTVTTLQNELNDATAKVTAAQTISSNIESTVIALQPSDYNSNHSVLSGDRDQLKTAQSDISAALTDAKEIITGLKSL